MKVMSVVCATMLFVCGCSRERVAPFDALSRAVLISNEVLIDFDVIDREVFGGGGWSTPENVVASGESFSWAMGERAELEVILAGGGPLHLGFCCWPFTWEGAGQQSIEIEVNGISIGKVELAANLQIYSMMIPPEAVRPGVNHMVFSFAYAMAPAEVNSASRDNRRLAVAFDWMAISQQAFGETKPQIAAVNSPLMTSKGLVTESGTGLLQSLEIPMQAHLSFAVEIEDRADASVWVQGWEREFVEVSKIGGSGMMSVDLEDFSGERVDLIFANHGKPGSGRVYWKQPLLNGLPLPAPVIHNIVLIIADTLRADALGCYGGTGATPHIDALAASGVLFEHAYSQIPITGPSHASLFTSLLPSEHGVHNNAQILAEDFVTIAEILRCRKFQTAAFTSLGVLNRRFGVAQGFAIYADEFANDWMRTAEELNTLATPWIEAYEQGPYFLLMHYSDPHEPYTPPGLDYPQVRLVSGEETLAVFESNGREISIELTLKPGANLFKMVSETKLERSLRFQHPRIEEPGFEIDFIDGWKITPIRFGSPRHDTLLPASIEITNHGADTEIVHLSFGCKENLKENDIRQRYQLEVEYLDEHIGQLLETLRVRGMLEDTLVVFVADHGEGLGDHGLLGHCNQLYDTLIRVPFIMSYPDRIKAGLRLDAAIGLIDFVPTVTDLLDIETKRGLSGLSLWPLVDGEKRSVPVFSETFRPESASDKKAVIFNGYKYIHSIRDREWEELYAVRSDEAELENIRDLEPQRVKKLRLMVDERLRSKSTAGADHAELSDADKARLEALGYVH